MTSPLSLDLFGDARGRAFAHEHAPSTAECMSRMKVLQHLVRRDASGILAVLNESRVEQSFNEQILVRCLDYKTLLSHGSGDYNVDPKRYNRTTGRYPGFQIGFFGAGPVADERRVQGELKGPGEDLDAPQRDQNYRSQTPVQQAFEAARGDSSIRWIIVSNYYEMRLYSVDDENCCAAVNLMQIETLDQFKVFYTLFSRTTLIGERKSLSPLDRLHTGQRLMELTAKDSTHPQIIHQASLQGAEHVSVPFGRLEDALVDALAYAQRHSLSPPWPPVRPGAYPKILGDSLGVCREISDGVECVVEATRIPSIKIIEYIELVGQSAKNSVGPIPRIETTEIVRRLLRFVAVGEKFMARLFNLKGFPGGSNYHISYRWDLDCLENSNCINVPSGWGHGPYLIQEGVTRAEWSPPLDPF